MKITTYALAVCDKVIRDSEKLSLKRASPIHWARWSG